MEYSNYVSPRAYFISHSIRGNSRSSINERELFPKYRMLKLKTILKGRVEYFYCQPPALSYSY